MRQSRAVYNRRAKLKQYYGLPPEAYDQILARQGGRCAICLREQHSRYRRRMAVDHDHASGEVRGLLCGDCNRGIGQMHDSPDIAQRAATYLGKALVERMNLVE